MVYDRELKIAVSERQLEAYRQAAFINKMSFSEWARFVLTIHLIRGVGGKSPIDYKEPRITVGKYPIYSSDRTTYKKRYLTLTIRVTEEFMDCMNTAAEEVCIKKSSLCVLILNEASGIGKLRFYLYKEKGKIK